MTDKERRGRRDVAVSIIFLMPTWSLVVLQEHHPLLPRIVQALGAARFFAILVVTYALAFGFALSAARMETGTGRRLGAITLGAVCAVGFGMYLLSRPRFI